MIARIWRGRTRESNQNSYFEYLQATGLKDYASTPGNRGVLVLRRVYEGKAEFTLISLWDSWDAIKALAGAEYARAAYYPDHKTFPLDPAPKLTHYEASQSGGRVTSESCPPRRR